MSDLDIHFNKFIEDGNAVSFEIIYRSTIKSLFVLAYSITHEKTESEDIVTEVFMKLLKHNNPKSIKNIKAFLQESVKNKSLDFIKSPKFKNKSSQNDGELTILNRSLNEDQPLASLLLKEMVENLERAMLEMEGDKKKVFEMIRLKGLTYQQTADAVGLSVKTVEKYMKQNLAILDKYNIPNSRKGGKKGNNNSSSNIISLVIISEVFNFFNFFSKNRRVSLF